MAQVKFARGAKADYNSTTYADAVYYCTDTGEVLLNGVEYSSRTQVEAMQETITTMEEFLASLGGGSIGELTAAITSATETATAATETVEAALTALNDCADLGGSSILSALKKGVSACYVGEIRTSAFDEEVAAVPLPTTANLIATVEDGTWDYETFKRFTIYADYDFTLTQADGELYPLGSDNGITELAVTAGQVVTVIVAITGSPFYLYTLQ